MILSQFRIDFEHAGQSTRMLDFGDKLLADPVITVNQEADRYAPIGAPWSEGSAKGGATTSIAWSSIEKYPDHASARAHCLAAAATLKSGQTGTLRIQVSGGDVWIISDLDFVTSATSPLVPTNSFETVTAATAIGGILSPVIPAEVLTIDATGLPKPDPLLIRITKETGSNGMEKWSEFGLIVPDEMAVTGSAATGWIDHLGYVSLRIHRSENLVDWTTGEFTDCAGSPEDNGDGTHTYWARSIFPVSSEIKTGSISSGGGTSYDTRMNPLIALTLGGVVQDLPNFPYTMPGDAAQMQTDLRAVGWNGATVTATSDILWVISIPSVFQEISNLSNKVYWPMFLVPDVYGNIVNPCDGRDLSGTWKNSADVRTEISPQFARLAYHLIPQ
ncbi:MAG: hypothetical protein WCP45_14910 [Verrucomicrobiota bacterium]